MFRERYAEQQENMDMIWLYPQAYIAGVAVVVVAAACLQLDRMK